MLCWEDNSWYTGRYASNRWFYVLFANGGEGYVHSSVVEKQTAVGACAGSIIMKATRTATDWYGQVYAPWWIADDYSDWPPGPYAEWAGDCIKFARSVYRAHGKAMKTGNAIDVYYQYKAEGRIKSGVPPRGALVFWNVSAFGHVAVSLGNGYVIGTQGGDNSYLPIAVYKTTTYGSYLGWAMP
jgi:hypothetical protein